MVFNMVEIQLDLASFHTFLYDVMGYRGRLEVDYGYAVHQWLAAAFGELAPKPWRFFINRSGSARVLGYSEADAQELRGQLNEFALPCAISVCPRPEVMINSKPMPQWHRGRRLGFQVLCCPVGRKAGSGVEKDLFLIRAEGGAHDLQRESVYADWLKERFEAGGATVHDVRMTGFRLVRLRRQMRFQTNQERKSARITRPHALLEGNLTVTDPESFAQMLRKGLGRHRSFGYGMILLSSPR
ncbi:MAG: type I-E CRISPR-associated protein Cas6/Cse3/CasE [Bacillota bacterium]|jgi:CRISPR system Cascade subunit CasE|nr:type I-E CRISPR-associated protein Cas6/Cse3/CasE [Bacillota bacterium]